MPTYLWHALDNQGNKKKGLNEADSPKALRQSLRKDGLDPISVELSDKIAKSRSKIKSFSSNISSKDLVSTSKQMATLIKSGLPIDNCLKAMIEQSSKAQHKNLLTSIKTKISEGFTLAQSLESFPNIFPKFYVATVAAGEKVGNIGTVLDRLADYLHSIRSTGQKVTLALLYPAIITVVALVVVIVLMTTVVPKIVLVFSSAEQDLPLLTQILISISEFLKNWGWQILLLLVFAFVGFRMSLKNDNLRRAYHLFLPKTPLFGRIIRDQNISRFVRTLGILLESRVDFYEAMRIASNTVEILPIRQSLIDATKMVREGSSVYIALRKTGYLSPISLNLIASGETSGTLTKMLHQSAENQDQETVNLISVILGAFEPLVVLIMGGVVFLIVMAILLPIFEMNNMVQ